MILVAVLIQENQGPIPQLLQAVDGVVLGFKSFDLVRTNPERIGAHGIRSSHSSAEK